MRVLLPERQKLQVLFQVAGMHIPPSLKRRPEFWTGFRIGFLCISNANSITMGWGTGNCSEEGVQHALQWFAHWLVDRRSLWDAYPCVPQMGDKCRDAGKGTSGKAISHFPSLPSLTASPMHTPTQALVHATSIEDRV